MRINYIFVDYENVQPNNLLLLNGHPIKILVFVGANQMKIPFDFAESMQQLGENAEYIKISGNGNNALDFHIAFYIGRYFQQNSDSYFHIISKDKGFDPLVDHLKEHKIFISRHMTIEDIPFLKRVNTKSINEQVKIVVERLIKLEKSKPRKLKTLKSSINALFLKQITKENIEEIVKTLVTTKTIVVNDQKVTYQLGNYKT